MLLAVDIGNTNISWGVFDKKKLAATWRTLTVRDKTSDEYGLQTLHYLRHFGLSKDKVKGIAISNVVPPLSRSFQEMGKRYFSLEPRFAGESLPVPMRILTDHPKEVGADMVVGAYAAYQQHGGPLLVVDFGTATTVSAVSTQGDFLGTAIAPGMAISMEALFQNAAKLPRIRLSKPASSIGKNTVHSMQSGCLYGFVGQLEKIVREMKQEMGARTRVIATGGLAEWIAGETKEISNVEPHLILRGLRALHPAA